MTSELPALINENIPAIANTQGIFGHSMGGHGALVCALRNPQRYKSVSAFAPISAPMRCPWGQKAFTGYLGSDPAAWGDYDASQLVSRKAFHSPILVDQGTSDKFLQEQLRPDLFAEACAQVEQPLELHMRAGYDHGYYFIQTFMADHVAWHAAALRA